MAILDPLEANKSFQNIVNAGRGRGLRKEVLPPGELESQVQVRHDSCIEAVD